MWLAIAASILVVGSLTSIFGAQAAARNDGLKAHQAAVTTSVEIASNLTLAIQREQDLAVNAGGFVIGNPNASLDQFQRWVSSTHVFERLPEIQGIAEVVMVPAAQLSTFAAHVEDPSAGLNPSGQPFQVSPPGARPYYCFATLSQSRTSQPVTPVGTDLCDTVLGPAPVNL